jgi:hypothetical protein
VDELLKRRLAHNEQLFREVNEQVQGLQARLRAREALFICECADQGCTATIPLGVDEYERLRGNRTWFFVIPGHERLEVEQVVERHPDYLVVDKPAHLLGPAAAD